MRPRSELPSQANLERARQTKEAVATFLYGSYLPAWDCALPQTWVDDQIASGWDPRGCVIWAYPSGFVFGEPWPLTQEAWDHLNDAGEGS
jgi:hypothetical protein